MINKFKHKTEPSGHPDMSNIEKDVTTAAETVIHSRCDNIKPERLAIQELKENKEIGINKADKVQLS